jgi:hypothetical protein
LMAGSCWTSPSLNPSLTGFSKCKKPKRYEKNSSFV